MRVVEALLCWMATFLTPRQEEELHRAILDYLASNQKFSDTSVAFAKEAGMEDLPGAEGRGSSHLQGKTITLSRIVQQQRPIVTGTQCL